MVQPEYPWDNREDRIRHYSDAGMLIRKTGTEDLYVDAVDVFPSIFSYEEADIPIIPTDESDPQEKNPVEQENDYAD